jgi:Mn2+/Fe2+ NRAMP family transporter
MRASMNAPAQPKTLLDWLRCFGPGAILASLTIGVGELVFSTRAGSLFGYRLLWFFALILFFKWLLVYSTARHIAISGVHPFQRWMELPGPRGWFPLIFLLLAVISFPVWVAFHSGTVGTLVAAITGTQNNFGGSAHFMWGLILLFICTVMSLAGGYKTLERAQIAIVAIMLFSVLAAFFVLKPNWTEFFLGLFLPQPVSYPSWAMEHAELRTRPIWVETITYVGIIGGSAYDYLAYVSYIREKRWTRESLRIILFDSITSFIAVLVFTAVFTSLGALILRPQHQIPSGTDLLTLQSQFVTPIFPALKYLYFLGAFLAVFGTLYGTIEVAPAIWREIALSMNPNFPVQKGRNLAVLWVCVVAALFLILDLARGNLPALIGVVTPANLFTGVLACGFVCLLAVWADYKWLAQADRMPIPLVILNVAGGVAFLALGIKGYSDYNSPYTLQIFAGTILVGLIAAAFLKLEKPAPNRAPAPASSP